MKIYNLPLKLSSKPGAGLQTGLDTALGKQYVHPLKTLENGAPE
jgi:hypothetical protein